MSTTPSTSDLPPSYTVVGGGKGRRVSGRRRGLSLILLHRGGILNRAEVFAEFERLGAEEILSIEGPEASYDIEPLSLRFPRIRFILLHSPADPGRRIDIGMRESSGDLAAVLWSDLSVPADTFSGPLVERLRKNRLLCAAPWFIGRKGEVLPALQAPAFDKKRLKVLSIVPTKEESPTLFPQDFCGIYDREKYFLLGGYDPGIENPYWQKMDFGFRAHLWGEKILCLRDFRLSPGDSVTAEDLTPDAGYRAFFLKNLAVRFTGDRGVLPLGRFASFYFRCGCGLLTAVREFRRVRSWVEKNGYRFRMDSSSVTELWEDPE